MSGLATKAAWELVAEERPMERQPKNPFHPGEMLLEEFLEPTGYESDGVCGENWLEQRAT